MAQSHTGSLKGVMQGQRISHHALGPTVKGFSVKELLEAASAVIGRP